MAKPLKILIASSEVHPYAKTGGLADVASFLPRALSQLGHDVRVILPKYKSVAKHKAHIRSLGLKFSIPVGKADKKASLFEGRINGTVPVYFVGHDPYYHRDPIYGDKKGDYPDNAERFIFFSRAVLEACKALSFRPDIIHCSDWQTALVPIYLKTLYAGVGCFAHTRSVFSIHNLGFQGNFDSKTMETAHLPWDLFTPEGVEFYGGFSFLKAGLVFADALTTVSKTYGKEILTPANGFKLDGVLRARHHDLSGILNGVDCGEWDPQKDPFIAQPYSPRSLKGKTACKQALIEEFSLDLPASAPLFCMVTRLSRQKGIDLVMAAMERLLETDSGFVLLGSGDPEYEGFFRKQAKRFPDRVACVIGFDEEMAHRIIAGSDLLLMPSRYEPCGLTQMYALRYGTVPIVRSVGGLKDTIKEFNMKTLRGTGFKFTAFELKYLLKAVRKALSVYRQPKHRRRIVLNGMAEDFSWNRVAQRYSRLYLKVLRR